jgi:hypothetical protein
MKLFVPGIGDKLTLEQDWVFEVLSEYRNDSLFDAIEKEKTKVQFQTYDGKQYVRHIQTNARATLPAGTILTVDRIYIRKGYSEFNSITFIVHACPDRRFISKSKGGLSSKAVRFWVKLSETRNMDISEHVD